jgi:hypothetical protein
MQVLQKNITYEQVQLCKYLWHTVIKLSIDVNVIFNLCLFQGNYFHIYSKLKEHDNKELSLSWKLYNREYITSIIITPDNCRVKPAQQNSKYFHTSISHLCTQVKIN